MTEPSLQLLADDPLPEGLWLLKWIDYFSIDHGSQSVHVELWFEALDGFEDKTAIQAMTDEDVQAHLPAPSGARRVVHTCRVQAAYVPMLVVGDVFEGTRWLTSLKTTTRRLRVNNSVSLQVGTNALTPPAGWKPERYWVLNQSEYGLPYWGKSSQSQCLVFEWDGVQYVLPKIVVFRTFFGIHTRLIDAVFKGEWLRSGEKLISTAYFESGLETGIDPETGAWKIVLQMGVPDWLAATLAYYWFDDYAKRAIASMYTDQLKQTEGTRGPDGKRWFANANIPHRLGNDGLEMTVRGFPLRPFRRFPPRSPERFLITAITGYEWTPGSQLICRERANSNARSENHTVDEDAVKPAYSGFKAPVTGMRDALAVSRLEGDASEPENHFAATGIEIWPKPNVKVQIKNSSQTGASQRPRASEGASPIVSAGSATYGETPAARAVLLQRVREVSEQFNFVTTALNELREAGRIETFAVVDAPADRAEFRSGLSCWALSTGGGKDWTFIKDPKVQNELPTGRPRCALIFRIETRGASVMLVEIEASNRKSGYSMYAWPASMTPEEDVEAVLGRIVQKKGRLKQADLSGVIAAPIRGFRHEYEDEITGIAGAPKLLDASEGGKRPVRRAIGLRADLLYLGLLRALDPALASEINEPAARIR